MMKVGAVYLVYIVLFLMLAACSVQSMRAPVMERSKLSKHRPEYHIVHQGETSYSIAWRYGMDYRELVSTNKLKAPYVLVPGQSLRLSPSLGSLKGQARARVNTQQVKVSGKNIAAGNASKKQQIKAAERGSQSSNQWLWPVKGALVSAFATSGRINKGIDISGKLGESVRSTQSGTVVYAGSGLLGYGKLIIVKHSKQYLSAYAHNSKIVVQEGQAVMAGAKIAEMGTSGTNGPMLHFEIRRDGRPVNPLHLLPKR